MVSNRYSSKWAGKKKQVMKPSRLKTVLETLLSQRWPAFVWGPPGIGKSAIVREVATAAKLPVIDLRASLLDPN